MQLPLISAASLSAGAVPSAAGIPEPLVTLVGDDHGILELDEAALGVKHRGLDRHHHAGFERPVGIVGRIGAAVDEPRRLVADEPHAMGEKLHVFVMGRCFHHLLGPADDLTAERARLDRLARALLDRIDPSPKVDQPGVLRARSRSSGKTASAMRQFPSALRSTASASDGRKGASTAMVRMPLPSRLMWSTASCMASVLPDEEVCTTGVQNRLSAFSWASRR